MKKNDDKKTPQETKPVDAEKPAVNPAQLSVKTTQLEPGITVTVMGWE